MMYAKIGLCLVIICINISIISAQINRDHAILDDLKDAWKNTPPSWDDGSEPCGGSWDGITCTNGSVTRIILATMQLSGGLPDVIGQFAELEILDLSYNKGLTGSLTSEIGNLRKLTNLFLVGCGFTGPIPGSIGYLENLIFLSLNSNGFSGPIPASVGNLTKLYWLDLTDNKLTGSIPVSEGTTPGLDMLTNARHFHLGDNQLSGDIPPGLFNSDMTLWHLLLENNKLTGTIPSTLGLVKSLLVVRLDRNSLSGNVTSNINNLTSLQNLFLAHNQLSGPIPDLIGMKELNYIDLSNNAFERSKVIPPWFSTLQALRIIKMYKTNLGGELPPALFSIPQLQIVELSDNQINGTLNISPNPSKQLQLVDLQNNQIADLVQRGEFEYSNPINLTLVGNTICKESNVRESFCSPTTNNTGSYSPPPSNCETPSCGSGLVQSPHCQCAHPYTGSMFFKAPLFSSLNVTIYNSLHDSLIEYFQNISLPVDSLSLNNPTRNADDYFVLKLEVFPFGKPIFNRTEIKMLGLALINSSYNPPTEFYIYYFVPETYNLFPAEEISSTKHKSLNTAIIVGLAVGCCLLVVLIVLVGMYFFRRNERADQSAPEQKQPFAHWDPTSGSGDVPQLKGARSFTFEELQKYTNNFSDINNIGKGGYGMVYKGSLPNGQLIAIKRAKKGSSQGGLEFKNEIELLSRVHHKNVVGLIGFCFEHDEQMLVYEYIVNGTLKDSLSGSSGIRLDWTRRLKIALGAARGLQYLHDHADPPIIHRDVKTDNILLDERLVAKVADFGLSKPFSDADRTHVTTKVKGTMGYVDPEYYLTQQLTEKSDTYSFGVVMLEVITARNPIEKGKYIVRAVKEAMNKNKELYDLHELLDPAIGLSSQLKGFERFVDLALRCVEEYGNQRPSMSEVVKELESIMELVGINPDESSSSTLASYEGASKDHNYLYSNDSLFSDSTSCLPPKLYQM